MTQIRMLEEKDFDALCDIVVNAYPGWKIESQEEKERVRQGLYQVHSEEPTTTMHGLFREGVLLGGMRFHDFTMNLFGRMIPAGGVGLVAVDLLHKKEHVAKEMMEYYVRHYRQQGAPLTLLYPFRPDFYRKMGFGYGTKMNQYRVRPSALPQGGAKSRVRYLGQDDCEALVDCYNRVLERTHGMMVKSEWEQRRMFRNPKHRIVAFEEESVVRGYMLFTFEHGESFITNDIQVLELIYESHEALMGLFAFLQTQADQIRHVIFNTQDESFHYLLLDPRNGTPELIPSVYHQTNVQGVGIMYRVVDVPGILEVLKDHHFDGQTCRIRLTVEDSFLPENAGSWLLGFENGRLRIEEEASADAQVRLDVADFSSLLVGAVDFESLHGYGLAEIDDAGHVELVDRVFAVKDKPICTTPF